jgi:hypothetical protein
MTYGCGSDACASCYPFQYRCANCNVDFPEPVPHGTPLPTCTRCGYDGINPDTIDPYVKDADGFCMACGEPHEAEACPIYVNGR